MNEQNKDKLEIIKNFCQVNTHNVEMLGTLEYLLSRTTISRPTVVTQIVDFIKHYYNHNSRRDRITYNLKYIYENQTSLNKSLGIRIIKTTTLKGGSRYYASKCILQDEDIITLVAAIKNDPYLDKEYSNSLIDKVISATTSQDKETINKMASKLEKHVSKIGKREIKLAKLLAQVEDGKTKLYVHYKSGKLKPFVGYLYKVERIRDELFGIFVSEKNQRFKKIGLAYIGKIDMDEEKTVRNIENYINYEGFASVNDYYNSFIYDGSGDKPIEITFKVYNSLPMQYISDSFENMFRTKLQYTMHKQVLKNATIEIYDCKAKLTIGAFKEWVKDLKVLQLLLFIKPKVVAVEVAKMLSYTADVLLFSLSNEEYEIKDLD